MDTLVPMPDWQGFDWSGGNAEKNWRRHQVGPSEAEQVFFNRPLLTAEDAGHSAGEPRWYVLGQSDRGRELFVAFTIRERLIRVVSARDMSRAERRVYRSP